MFKYIIYLIIFVLLVLKIKNRIKIKYKTFIKRGFKKTSKPYGVYCYCGKQGKGKTYSVVEFLMENKNKEIYCNISSITGINYHYINGIDELLELRNKTNCIIVFDEIFTILQKGTKMNDDILDFLSQMRKREMIFITTAQEWLEINMTLRRYCRYQIECNMISIFKYPILIKSMYDAEKMKWSQEDNEYIAPIVATTISHGLKRVINSYDTYEQIGKYSALSKNQNNDTLDIEIDDIENNVYSENLESTEIDSNFALYEQNSSDESVNQEPVPLYYDYKGTGGQWSVDKQNDLIDINNNDNKIIDFDNIDNDFWEFLSIDDFDQNVK